MKSTSLKIGDMTSTYKVFTFSLARRLSPHLHYCILLEQKGFIKGRFILDSIITLWETLELAIDTNIDLLFLKIDFDKAYDRVEWDFIF